MTKRDKERYSVEQNTKGACPSDTGQLRLRAERSPQPPGACSLCYCSHCQRGCVFSNKEQVGRPRLVWSLVLNYHTVLSGIFIPRKQVITASCLPRVGGRQKWGRLTPLGHPTGETMVDPTPLKTASEKSVWAGWRGVRLRGPQRCSQTGRFACFKMLGLSWQGAETGRLRTRGPPDRRSGAVFLVGFKLRAWRLQTEDRKPSRIFPLLGCTSKGPTCFLAFRFLSLLENVLC